MPDAGVKSTDRAFVMTVNKIERLYKDALKEVKAQLKEHTDQFAVKDAQKQAQLAAGKITEAQYKSWVKGQAFVGEQWQRKIDSITSTLLHANEHATAIIDGDRRAVFGENATYQAYALEKGAGLDLSFTVYDNATVTRLISKTPELMPRKTVNGVKDKAWNKKLIANAIAQGVIQGDSIKKIADRIAVKTGSANSSAMVRYARTAMTAAQNAGRIEAMHDAVDMGIKVLKVWIATLDDRTRDAHAELDGQVQEVDKPFDSNLGPIMYPGDPGADEANVWNCRCALGYEYKEYPNEHSMRRDNIDGELIADMDYEEWRTVKSAGKLKDYSDAKMQFYKLDKQVKDADADHVFVNIWKDDVTYADYSARQASIQAKRDYFTDRINKATAAGNTVEADKFRGLLDELELFAANGAANEKLLTSRNQALKNAEDMYKQALGVAPPKKAKGPFTPDAYSKQRKDAALWAKTEQEADNALRGRTGDVWRAASAREKAAIFEYTQSYHKFNEPLRGIEYGTNVYKGVGKTDLNAGRANNGEMLNSMTDILDKSTYDRDVWLQRGVGYSGMDKFFACTQDLLKYGTQKELENELLGKAVTEYGFMSCGTKKGKGFDNNIMLNVYAPKGTKMMYVEPFSAFGQGDGIRWDGKRGQKTYGYEFETILQQGTQMRVTKIERSGNKIFFDLEVIDQSKQQRWKK